MNLGLAIAERTILLGERHIAREEQIISDMAQHWRVLRWPVRRENLDRHGILCLDPSLQHAAAGKYKPVRTLSIDHRQFQIAVERRRSYGLPFHPKMVGQFVGRGFDLADHGLRSSPPFC
jgi:hypothetical protein